MTTPSDKSDAPREFEIAESKYDVHSCLVKRIQGELEPWLKEQIGMDAWKIFKVVELEEYIELKTDLANAHMNWEKEVRILDQLRAAAIEERDQLRTALLDIIDNDKFLSAQGAIARKALGMK